MVCNPNQARESQLGDGNSSCPGETTPLCRVRSVGKTVNKRVRTSPPNYSHAVISAYELERDNETDLLKMFNDKVLLLGTQWSSLPE